MPPKPADVSAANKERNEYIPSFIAKKPFYVDDLGEENDYLEHQRLQKTQAEESKWYDRGKKAGPAATKFRKGACENCGAMTHKAKDCLQRPRKKGAKWTGKDIQADEVVQDVNLGWDAKRDRWNGYDASEYAAVIEEYNQLEDIKKGTEAGRADGDGDGENADKDEGDRYEEETDMGRHQSTSTRNLRLREDTAKYLLNLDLDSAKYDPKTRSMVDKGATSDEAAALVAEEGFMKMSGDAAEFERMQKYAWESQERGDKNKLHLQANPTSGEFLRKKEEQEKAERREAQKKALAEKYGGQDHLTNNPLKDMAVTESERFVEYDEDGTIKGAPKIKPKSKYPEDVLINNHKSVWGSWWSNFIWGYACCHSTVKNSYCTGEQGKLADEESQRLRNMEITEAPEEPEEEAAKEERLRELEESRQAKKRTLDDMKGGISEAEMEEYKRKKHQANDPMANLLGKDELV